MTRDGFAARTWSSRRLISTRSFRPMVITPPCGEGSPPPAPPDAPSMSRPSLMKAGTRAPVSADRIGPTATGHLASAAQTVARGDGARDGRARYSASRDDRRSRIVGSHGKTRVEGGHGRRAGGRRCTWDHVRGRELLGRARCRPPCARVRGVRRAVPRGVLRAPLADVHHAQGDGSDQASSRVQRGEVVVAARARRRRHPAIAPGRRGQARGNLPARHRRGLRRAPRRRRPEQ